MMFSNRLKWGRSLKLDSPKSFHWLQLISTNHLQGYIDEYTLRYNTRKNCTCDRFNLILVNMIGRLTYKDLIA